MKTSLKIILFLSIFIFLFGLARAVKAETRYMRADNVLGTAQTATPQTVSSTVFGDVDVYWGMRVWAGGAEIQPGTYKAQVFRLAGSGFGFGEQSANWVCPLTPLAPGDTVTVRVYMRFGAGVWQEQAAFTTGVLGASQLDLATWAVSYRTFRNLLAGQTLGAFSYGDPSVNSRIEGFSYTVAAVCTRNPPTITALNTPQSGTPGTLLTYNFNATNTDTAGCGLTALAFSITDCPAGWTCTTGNVLLVAPGATVPRSLTITSSAGALPGNYDLTAQVQNAASSLTGTTIIRYTVAAAVCVDTDGGEDKLVKGTCTSAHGSFTDSCLGAHTINEMTCNPAGDACWVIALACPPDHPNCVDGACVAAVCPPGCDGICPAGCVGNPADPDCVCQPDAANCCGIGCSHAQDSDCALITIINPLGAESFEELIENLINFIFWVAVAIVPIMIIVAAFYFLTSGGDPEKVRTAKKIILYTCIGLAMVLFAKGIISLIKTVIEG